MIILQKKSWQKTSSLVSDSPPREAAAPMLQPDSAHSSLLPSGTDDWEIDSSQLKYTSKLANGSFGDL